MENKRVIKVGDLIRITMITKLGVQQQRFIPKLDTIYTVVAINEKAIKLHHEKYGNSVYPKGSLKFRFQDIEKSI